MRIREKIAAIEAEIRETPYHKGTERHIGKLKARLAKLKKLLYAKRWQGNNGSTLRKAKGFGAGFAVSKSGDATVVLVGPPSVGKSTLINVLTDVRSKVGEYEFTTLKVVPGIMRHNGAAIQILDVPGLVEGAALGKGRGLEILSVARTADLIVLMTDVGRVEKLKIMERELYEAGVRLNRQPPKVTIGKKSRGGLAINSPRLSQLSKTTVQDIAREFGLANAEITIEEDITVDRLVDVFAGNRVYAKALFVINKIDEAEIQTSAFKARKNDNVLYVSAKEKINLSRLKKAFWDELKLIRIYLKNKNGKVDYDKPLIMRNGAKVKEAVEKLSSGLAAETGGAKIWGAGAAFPGQKVGLNYRLSDETVVRFV